MLSAFHVESILFFSKIVNLDFMDKGFTKIETSSNNSASKLPNTFRALKHKNFRLFFSGQFVSLVGTWMQSVAQSWLVYRLTGSVVLLGLVGFASQIPVFFARADWRIGRRQI